MSIIVLSVFVAGGIMFWNLQAGAIALVLGLLIMLRTLGVILRRSTCRKSPRPAGLSMKHNSAHTDLYYVQQIDDAGNDLPADLVRAKLAEVQQRAGPRDAVLGVRRKVE